MAGQKEEDEVAKGSQEEEMAAASAGVGDAEDSGETMRKIQLEREFRQERAKRVLWGQAFFLIATPIALIVVQYGARGLLRRDSSDRVVAASFVSWVFFAINVFLALMVYTTCNRLPRFQLLLATVNTYACGFTAGFTVGSVALMHDAKTPLHL